MSNTADFGLVPRIINASIAGIVGVTCVFPLDLAKTRWQNTPASVGGAPRLYNSYLDCFVKTFRNEGLRGMYKGSSVNLLLITPEKAIKLVANDGFRYLLKKNDGSLPVYRQVLAGASAGMCQIVITTPMELLKIALQDSGRVAAASLANNKTGAAAANVKTPTATQIAMQVFKQKVF
jgi:solute carrier family 25 (mitochondrial glutamate transporter), member 18/22